MNGMNPTSLEDRLGFFVAAQLHGYPLLFVAAPDARERAHARRRPARSRVTGLADGARRAPAACPGRAARLHRLLSSAGGPLAYSCPETACGT